MVDFAAKFALLQIDDPQVAISAEILADRMARCLRRFSERDAHLAQVALARHTGRLVLHAWWDNNQCWGRAMPGYLVELYKATAHLGEQRDVVWREFLEELREYKDTFNEIAQGTGLLEVQADA